MQFKNSNIIPFIHSLIFALIFWTLQFGYQFYFLIPGNFELSILRSAAFTGATIIGFSLLSSVFFKFKPTWVKYWRYRRYLGVVGFAIILVHIFTALNVYFLGYLSIAYYSLNPFENPVMFGTIAGFIFLTLLLTSTDWAVKKIGAAKWKNLHRLVYIAEWGAIFHFLNMNPPQLYTIPGYILLIIIGVTVLGQLYWFFNISSKNQFKSKGAIIGVMIILLFLITLYLLYF